MAAPTLILLATFAGLLLLPVELLALAARGAAFTVSSACTVASQAAAAPLRCFRAAAGAAAVAALFALGANLALLSAAAAAALLWALSAEGLRAAWRIVFASFMAALMLCGDPLDLRRARFLLRWGGEDTCAAEYFRVARHPRAEGELEAQAAAVYYFAGDFRRPPPSFHAFDLYGPNDAPCNVRIALHPSPSGRGVDLLVIFDRRREPRPLNFLGPDYSPESMIRFARAEWRD